MAIPAVPSPSPAAHRPALPDCPGAGAAGRRGRRLLDPTPQQQAHGLPPQPPRAVGACWGSAFLRRCLDDNFHFLTNESNVWPFNFMTPTC